MDWKSYDTVAETYDDSAGVRFAPFASDLVAAVRPQRGEVTLDLGTGTGLVTRQIRATAGVDVTVVGLDPSLGMLRQGRTHPGCGSLVAGAAPGIPARDDAFDAVAANLVLSHLPDPDAALRDIGRVVRAGGRVGCTAWGPDVPVSPEHQAPEAHAIVQERRHACGLDMEPPEPVVPWEDRFRDPSALEEVLRGGGFADVTVEMHTHRRTVSVDDYLAMLDWVPISRYLRAVAGQERWQEARDEAERALRDRFAGGIASTSHLWVAVGRK